MHRRRKRGGQGGPGPHNNLRGGANIPFGPPNNPPTCNDVASTSFRRRVPTRFLINQCQIITFLILKYDIIENSRIELRGIVLPVQVGGLLGGPKGMLAPPLKLLWGPGPPWPPLFLRLCILWSSYEGKILLFDLANCCSKGSFKELGSRSFLLPILTCNTKGSLASSADPAQMPHDVASDKGLHC